MLEEAFSLDTTTGKMYSRHSAKNFLRAIITEFLKSQGEKGFNSQKEVSRECKETSPNHNHGLAYIATELKFFQAIFKVK